ncbi:hypothetical protein [Streptomyces sp. NPDC054940]
MVEVHEDVLGRLLVAVVAVVERRAVLREERLRQSDMTDAEWAVVRPLLPVPGWLRGRGNDLSSVPLSQPFPFVEGRVVQVLLLVLVGGGEGWDPLGSIAEVARDNPTLAVGTDLSYVLSWQA